MRFVCKWFLVVPRILLLLVGRANTYGHCLPTNKHSLIIRVFEMMLNGFGSLYNRRFICSFINPGPTHPFQSHPAGQHRHRLTKSTLHHEPATDGGGQQRLQSAALLSAEQTVCISFAFRPVQSLIRFVSEQRLGRCNCLVRGRRPTRAVVQLHLLVRAERPARH